MTKLTHSEAGKLGAIASKVGSAKRQQQRIDNYNLNPTLCKYCSSPFSYEKRHNDYCSQSCSAKLFNINRGFQLAENKTFTCLFCFEIFKSRGTDEHKYCSRDCMKKYWWQETKQELINTNQDLSYGNRIGKKYLIELNDGKCQICHLNKWCEKSMPLVIDHINGNPNDNTLTNLRIICNNCDAQTSHYKGKNKGNGRYSRRQRYKEGKSY